jgi:hypothetical protein
MLLEKNNEGKMDGAQKSEALLEMVKEKKMLIQIKGLKKMLLDIDVSKRVTRSVNLRLSALYDISIRKLLAWKNQHVKVFLSTFMPKEELM